MSRKGITLETKAAPGRGIARGLLEAGACFVLALLVWWLSQ